MRVISQDGTFDMPYKMSIVWCEDAGAVLLQPIGETGEYQTFAKYSTEEKAKKAMEMLREQYSRIEIIKALASGTCKHMEESLKPEEFKDILKKYINMEAFQFPQDDEIEV
jgi:hypothetical protein